MKKKILSLVLGLFMGIFSLFSLASCSLVQVDEEKENAVEMIRIGDTILTKQDVINGFYTYYQNNSNYFAYYDSQNIEESFYQWLIVRQIINDRAREALYSQSNPNGFIYYTVEEEEDVWNSVLSYFYNQVNTKEKVLYASDKNYSSEEDYPVWLQTDDGEEEATEFEPFATDIPEIDPSKRTPDKLRDKLSEEVVKSRAAEVEKYIFEYVPDKNNLDANDEPVREKINEENYKKGARKEAYTLYRHDLVSNAKNSGDFADMDNLFKNEIYRIYEAYYDAKITELFQNYFVGEYLINFEGKGDGVSLGDAAIVEAFINQYYTDKQIYSSEKGYIDTITSSDGASLLLYHYDGVYYYFSVQHILLKFSSLVEKLVNKIPEKRQSTNDPDYESYFVYEQKRNNYTLNEYYNSMLTKVNVKEEDEETEEVDKDTPKSLFESVAVFGDYYYFNEKYTDLYGFYYIPEKTEDVTDTTPVKVTFNSGDDNYSSADGETYSANQVAEIYGGYIKLTSHTYEAATNTVSYTHCPVYDRYIEDAELYATEKDIIECYENTYDFWVTQIETYLDHEEQRESLVEKYPDLEYIFDMALSMKDAGDSLADVYSKVSTMLFVELEWVYSSDTLGNEISNKIGYVCSSYPGENGDWVTDFPLYARQLMAKLDTLASTESTFDDGTGTKYSKLEAILLGKEGDIKDLTVSFVSDYGIHIMKIADKFECGSSVFDVNAIIKKYGTKADYTNTAFVKEVADLLKTKYLTSASNQTLYEYFKESLYKNFIGDDSSSGTYFLALEYKWLSELYKDEKIVYTSRLTYDELMESIN